MQSTQGVSDIVRTLRNLGITNIVDTTNDITASHTSNIAFFCTHKAKANNYDAKALELGANAIIQITNSNSIMPYISISSWKDYTNLLKEFFPIQNLKIIGITGTNGKTSTAHFGATLCSLMQKKSATIGTNGICIYENGKIISQEKTSLTTTTCTKNHSTLHNLTQQGVQFIFMEASSIGIHQGRLDGIKFDVSCFTNFSQDHLDYHHTMDEYFAQKLRLFTEFTKINDNETGLSVLNSEDRKSQEIVKFCKNIAFFGKSAKYDDILQSYEKNHSGFLLNFGNLQAQFNASGNFQILNLMCIVHTLIFLGFKLEQIAMAIPKLLPPDGRMQSVVVGDITVIIDYAHTPDALENVLKNIDGYKICVFGCGGNRDSTKRSIMGEIASKLSDYVIVTSDNPRFERPDDIALEIASGITKTNYEIILDRKSAILHAIKICQKDGIVIISGKGSEDYQEINGERISFSDIKVVKDIFPI